MKPGGGKNKGAAFERLVGRELSLWLTRQERDDLFSRNVLSGGRFTIRQGKGKTTAQPGDLMAAHPLAFEFMSNFLVECKHVANMHLEAFLFDKNGSAFLSKVIALSVKQGNEAGLNYFVIVRQNRLPTLIFMSSICGLMMRNTARPRNALRYHILAGSTVYMAPFEDFLKLCHPDRFIAMMPPKIARGS